MAESSQENKVHYAWWILAACCLINMSALGLTNTNGLFYPEICAELGFSLSALSVHTTVVGLTSALVLLFVDKIYKKYDTRLLITGALLIYHASYMAMAFFNAIWQFCLASVFTGIGCAFLLYIPVPMLINNWFVKSKKTALSICFVASGFSGILCSLLLGYTISAFGWRASYLIRGALLLLLSAPVFFIVKKTPGDMGLVPYGYKTAAEETKQNAAAAERSEGGKGHKEGLKEGRKEERVFGDSARKHSFEEKRIKFIFAIVLAITCNLSCGMTIQLPGFATSIGLSIAMGSYLTSMAMVGNIASKASFGPLLERFSVVPVTCILFLIMLLGWLIPGFGITATGPIMVAAVTTGLSACANTLVIPNLVDTFVRGDEYVHVLARCSTGTMIASAFSTMISSGLFDLFGSYAPVFLCYAGLMAVNILIVVFVFGRK